MRNKLVLGSAFGAWGLLLQTVIISLLHTSCKRVRGKVIREAWALRRERCEESWRLQKLRQELDQAEAWLACREGLLLDPNCGVSQGPAP